MVRMQMALRSAGGVGSVEAEPAIRIALGSLLAFLLFTQEATDATKRLRSMAGASAIKSLLIARILALGLRRGGWPWAVDWSAAGALACRLLPADACVLGVAPSDDFGEPVDRRLVGVVFADVGAGEVNVGALSSAAEGDVGALAVGLPAAGEDERALA